MPRKPPPRTKTTEPSSRRLAEIAIAFGAFLLVVAELDPTGTFPWLPDGPGLTVDEVLNVQQGVRTEVGIRNWLAGEITLRELFGDAEELGRNAPFGYHATDYPPLGRYLLGVAHNLVTTFAFPAGWETPFVIAAARFGSAIAFAVTLWLVSTFATETFGRPAGLIAAVSCLLMPRLFGHAHLASLETIIGLFYAATILSIARRWDISQSVSNKAALIAGLWWGLALLVKIQAVLIPPAVTIWAFWHWRQKAFRSLAIMAIVGLATFFVGWPWLWFDPWGHFWGYFAQTTDRASLPVWYLGQVYTDRAVPWHYPFVITAATVPLGLLALTMLGFFGGKPAGWRDARCQFIAMSVVLPLAIFAIPGVTNYDGARLFLVAFPLMAVLAGCGGSLAWQWLRERCSVRVAALIAAIFMLVPASASLAVRPVYLSGYSWTVGGVWGAERLGFEVNYWADALTSELLTAAAKQVPPGGTLAVSPVLHQFQLDDLRTQSPALRRRDIRLVEYGTPEAKQAVAILVYQRRASLPEELHSPIEDYRQIQTVERQGITLAGLYAAKPELPNPKSLSPSQP